MTDTLVERALPAFQKAFNDCLPGLIVEKEARHILQAVVDAMQPALQRSGLVADLRHLLRDAEIEGEGTVITITVNDRAARMNLIGHLANLRDRVV